MKTNFLKKLNFLVVLSFLALTNTVNATSCPATRTVTAFPLSAVWVNAGANESTTFYYGLTQSKDMRVVISGGVGPFTYAWTNSAGYTLQARPNINEIRLWDPLGATKMRVTVTDQGTGCVYKDSIQINWTDKYVAGKTGPHFIYKTCRNYNTVLITGFDNLRDKIQAGTHTLGACTNCGVTANMGLASLNPFWVNAGANNANVFYHGITQWKKITVNVSGGVGPFTYTWNTRSGYLLKPTANANQVDLFEPLGAAWVRVIIKDNGANCTFADSVYVGWSDEYYCGDVSNYWKLKMCQGGLNVCMTWNDAKAALQAIPPTATLGYCVIPKTDLQASSVDFKVYPNPTNGMVTLVMPINQTTTGQISIIDINGRVVYTENIGLVEGIFEHNLNMNTLPNGVYFVQLVSQNDVKSQRIQVIK